MRFQRVRFHTAGITPDLLKHIAPLDTPPRRTQQRQKDITLFLGQPQQAFTIPQAQPRRIELVRPYRGWRRPGAGSLSLQAVENLPQARARPEGSQYCIAVRQNPLQPLGGFAQNPLGQSSLSFTHFRH
ncbi:MAG: hypothetical protein JWO78_811 [Micavibrio sp.]|nr:hypothetical protein [Micavibrio sp.]